MMTMQDFLATQPEDPEEEMRKRLAAANGGTAAFSGGPIGNVSQVPASAFDFSKVGFSPEEAASMQAAKARGVTPATMLENRQMVANMPTPPSSFTPEPSRPVYNGILSNIFSQDEMHDISRLNDKLAGNATGTIAQMIFKPDEIGDMKKWAAAQAPAPGQSTLDNMVASAKRALGIPQEPEGQIFRNIIGTDDKPEGQIFRNIIGTDTPSPQFGPALPSSYAFANGRMIQPLESGNFSTAQSPTGKITLPDGRTFDSGPAPSSGAIGAGYFLPSQGRDIPGAFDQGFNLQHADYLSPQSRMERFQMDAERMKLQNELDKARILSGQSGMKDLTNPNAPPDLKHADIDKSNYSKEDKDRLHLGVDLGNAKLQKSVEGYNPASPGNPFAHDPRGSLSADFSQLAKLDRAQSMSSDALNKFLSDRQVTPQMIQNRMGELLDKSRGHYFMKGLIATIADMIPNSKGLGDMIRKDLGNNEPKLSRISPDEQKELDFILRKFGNPDMQKKGLSAFFPEQ